MFVTHRVCCASARRSVASVSNCIAHRCATVTHQYRFLCHHVAASVAKDSRTNVVDPRNAILKLLDRKLIAQSFPGSLLSCLSNPSVQSTPNAQQFNQSAPIIYAGFDPTSPSLHIGHLLIVNSLLHLAADGFKVIFVIGSATAQLGDPSGRSADRPLLLESDVHTNAECIRAQLQRLIDNFEQHILPELSSSIDAIDYEIVDNRLWYDDMNLISFMSQYGRHFRVGNLLKRQIIRDRLETTGLPLQEFVYQTLQAYDWLQLYERFGCRMQLGGSDQLAHLDIGYHLLKQHTSDTQELETFGFTCPLMTDNKGNKIGKSNVAENQQV